MCAHNSDVLVLHGRCHMLSPTWVEIHKIENLAVIKCAECGQTISTLELCTCTACLVARERMGCIHEEGV